MKGRLPDWVSAKDIILEMLRRHDVKGGVGWIIEYFGSGLECLTAMDRHVIANMGAELGATTTVFPSDQAVATFLESQGRKQDWIEMIADEDANYDEYEEIDLSALEPLIACPRSPGNVVRVKEVAGREVFQVVIGSSANPGFRDFAISAAIVDGKQIHERVSFDINPTSRQILENLIAEGSLEKLVKSGARIHQAGCDGCIGMGQAPATQKISLRTVPRNFPGRSGTKEDLVYLCSPETGAASALTGVITDPRELKMGYPKIEEPKNPMLNKNMILEPKEYESVELIIGPNIKPIPKFGKCIDRVEGPVLIKVENHISTDEILPAGSSVLPYRSNIPEISKFTFLPIDETYYSRTVNNRDTGHFIVAGLNYGQGSSREHAAIACRFLGVKAVIAKSFARIHWDNLINFGILPLVFNDRQDYSKIDLNDILVIENIIESIPSQKIQVHNKTKDQAYLTLLTLSKRQMKIILEGGCINLIEKTSLHK